MDSAFVLANDPRVEPPVDNEQEKIEQLKEVVSKIQDRNYKKHRHAFRGTHVKTQAIVKGRLEVKDGLPEHLAQGLFSKSKTYDIAMRYATEPSHILPDTQNAPRGIGMRIFGVDGEKLKDSNPEQGGWHDLFMNNAPMLELKDLDTTLEIFTLREKYFESPLKYNAAIMLRKDALTQAAPGFLPNQHPMSFTFYSQAAYTHGPYVAKYRLEPILDSQKALSSIKPTEPDEIMHMLAQYFSSHPARYSLDVQMCRDLDKQPVEDTQTEWKETDSPWETVAILELPVGQDSASDERRVFWEDRMAIGPWEGLKAHVPLGSVNRLRKAIYAHSRENRQARNVTAVQDVRGVDEIP